MKRFATLALAAIFALSFTANVAAAPEFSGKFTVENEIDLTAEAINVKGDGADLTFSLGAGEEGVWSLSVNLGSALQKENATKLLQLADGSSALVSHEVLEDDVAKYYKDPDGDYYYKPGGSDNWVKVDSDLEKAKIDREIANRALEWTAVKDANHEDSYTQLELGAYKL